MNEYFDAVQYLWTLLVLRFGSTRKALQECATSLDYASEFADNTP